MSQRVTESACVRLAFRRHTLRLLDGASFLPRCLLAIVICAATAAPVCAGVVFQELAAYQAFTVDAALAVANLGGFGPDVTGIDPSSVLNYSSTFDSTGAVNGIFTGTYQGDLLTGTLSDSVSGDPNYMLTGGVAVTVNAGKPNDTMINVNIDNNGKLNGSSIGGKSGFNLAGTLTETMNGNMYTFKGDVTMTGFGPLKGTNYNASATITVTGTGKNQEVTSKFEVKKPIFTYYDNGKVQFEQTMNGMGWDMTDQATAAPEPSGLALASIALVLVFGYRRSTS
jgi:hypothetical protein